MTSSNLTKQSGPEESSLKYYHSIEFLPIGCFNKIIETGDLRYLLKLDDYEYLPECSLNLSQAWESISKEYLEQSKTTNKKTEVTFWIEREILGLKADWWYAKGLIWLLSKEIETGRCISELNALGIEVKDGSPEQIKFAEARKGLIKNKIKIKEAELKRLKKEDNQLTFEDLLISVEKFTGYHIDIWVMSVKRWLSLVKNYEIYCNELSKHARGKDK